MCNWHDVPRTPSALVEPRVFHQIAVSVLSVVHITWLGTHFCAQHPWKQLISLRYHFQFCYIFLVGLFWLLAEIFSVSVCKRNLLKITRWAENSRLSYFYQSSTWMSQLRLAGLGNV